MFKITTFANAGMKVLKLEGRLTGPWIEELDRCWQEIIVAHQRQVLVDLSEVTFIGPDAKGLLTRMWQHGARFHAAGCLNASIVQEITQQDTAETADPTDTR